VQREDSVSLLEICQKKYKSGYNKPMFIAALFTIAKLWTLTRCPKTNEWIKKCGVYIHWNFIQP
jgi:hypothetical protein